jgi:hypothetical protein
MLGMPVLLLVWLAGRVKIVDDSSNNENKNK